MIQQIDSNRVKIRYAGSIDFQDCSKSSFLKENECLDYPNPLLSLEFKKSLSQEQLNSSIDQANNETPLKSVKNKSDKEIRQYRISFAYSCTSGEDIRNISPKITNLQRLDRITTSSDHQFVSNKLKPVMSRIVHRLIQEYRKSKSSYRNNEKDDKSLSVNTYTLSISSGDNCLKRDHKKLKSKNLRKSASPYLVNSYSSNTIVDKNCLNFPLNRSKEPNKLLKGNSFSKVAKTLVKHSSSKQIKRIQKYHSSYKLDSLNPGNKNESVEIVCCGVKDFIHPTLVKDTFLFKKIKVINSIDVDIKKLFEKPIVSTYEFVFFQPSLNVINMYSSLIYNMFNQDLFSLNLENLLSYRRNIHFSQFDLVESTNYYHIESPIQNHITCIKADSDTWDNFKRRSSLAERNYCNDIPNTSDKRNSSKQRRESYSDVFRKTISDIRATMSTDGLDRRYSVRSSIRKSISNDGSSILKSFQRHSSNKSFNRFSGVSFEEESLSSDISVMTDCPICHGDPIVCLEAEGRRSLIENYVNLLQESDGIVVKRLSNNAIDMEDLKALLYTFMAQNDTYPSAKIKEEMIKRHESIIKRQKLNEERERRGSIISERIRTVENIIDKDIFLTNEGKNRNLPKKLLKKLTRTFDEKRHSKNFGITLPTVDQMKRISQNTVENILDDSSDIIISPLNSERSLELLDNSINELGVNILSQKENYSVNKNVTSNLQNVMDGLKSDHINSKRTSVVRESFKSNHINSQLKSGASAKDGLKSDNLYSKLKSGTSAKDSFKSDYLNSKLQSTTDAKDGFKSDYKNSQLKSGTSAKDGFKSDYMNSKLQSPTGAKDGFKSDYRNSQLKSGTSAKDGLKNDNLYSKLTSAKNAKDDLQNDKRNSQLKSGKTSNSGTSLIFLKSIGNSLDGATYSGHMKNVKLIEKLVKDWLMKNKSGREEILHPTSTNILSDALLNIGNDDIMTKNDLLENLNLDEYKKLSIPLVSPSTLEQQHLIVQDSPAMRKSSKIINKSKLNSYDASKNINGKEKSTDHHGGETNKSGRDNINKIDNGLKSGRLSARENQKKSENYLKEATENLISKDFQTYENLQTNTGYENLNSETEIFMTVDSRKKNNLSKEDQFRNSKLMKDLENIDNEKGNDSLEIDQFPTEAVYVEIESKKATDISDSVSKKHKKKDSTSVSSTFDREKKISTFDKSLSKEKEDSSSSSYETESSQDTSNDLSAKYLNETPDLLHLFNRISWENSEDLLNALRIRKSLKSFEKSGDVNKKLSKPNGNRLSNVKHISSSFRSSINQFINKSVRNNDPGDNNYLDLNKQHLPVQRKSENQLKNVSSKNMKEYMIDKNIAPLSTDDINLEKLQYAVGPDYISLEKDKLNKSLRTLSQMERPYDLVSGRITEDTFLENDLQNQIKKMIDESLIRHSDQNQARKSMDDNLTRSLASNLITKANEVNLVGNGRQNPLKKTVDDNLLGNGTRNQLSRMLDGKLIGNESQNRTRKTINEGLNGNESQNQIKKMIENGLIGNDTQNQIRKMINNTLIENDTQNQIRKMIEDGLLGSDTQNQIRKPFNEGLNGNETQNHIRKMIEDGLLGSGTQNQIRKPFNEGLNGDETQNHIRKMIEDGLLGSDTQNQIKKLIEDNMAGNNIQNEIKNLLEQCLKNKGSQNQMTNKEIDELLNRLKTILSKSEEFLQSLSNIHTNIPRDYNFTNDTVNIPKDFYLLLKNICQTKDQNHLSNSEKQELNDKALKEICKMLGLIEGDNFKPDLNKRGTNADRSSGKNDYREINKYLKNLIDNGNIENENSESNDFPSEIDESLMEKIVNCVLHKLLENNKNEEYPVRKSQNRRFPRNSKSPSKQEEMKSDLNDALRYLESRNYQTKPIEAGNRKSFNNSTFKGDTHFDAYHNKPIIKKTKPNNISSMIEECLPAESKSLMRAKSLEKKTINSLMVCDEIVNRMKNLLLEVKRSQKQIHSPIPVGSRSPQSNYKKLTNSDGSLMTNTDDSKLIRSLSANCLNANIMIPKPSVSRHTVASIQNMVSTPFQKQKMIAGTRNIKKEIKDKSNRVFLNSKTRYNMINCNRNENNKTQSKSMSKSGTNRKAFR